MNDWANYDAYVVEKTENGVTRDIRLQSSADLEPDEVRIAVEWSSVNYKDALVATASGRVARISPLVPGIDMAGVVVESAAAGVSAGDRVIAHGYDLGVARDGGFAKYAAVPAQWLVPLPQNMTTRQAMILGTAGFTAALSVQALQASQVASVDGPVLVTGATGGVGSVAVTLLGNLGYEVIASTGRLERASWLESLGAAKVVDRLPAASKALVAEQWAAVVDSVGGSTLTSALAAAKYGGVVTACGNTGGVQLDTTVFPFILRGVTLYGIDSVACPHDVRVAAWQYLARHVTDAQYESLVGEEVGLHSLSAALDQILGGGAVGRTIVRQC